MLTDKDFILKSSRAFVSYIRSYKEHKLNNILKFDSLDPLSVARSFFLFKFPVMREFKDLTVDPAELASADELKKFEAVEFLNKNQEEMIKKKIEEAIEGSKCILLQEKESWRKGQPTKNKERKNKTRRRSGPRLSAKEQRREECKRNWTNFHRRTS